MHFTCAHFLICLDPVRIVAAVTSKPWLGQSDHWQPVIYRSRGTPSSSHSVLCAGDADSLQDRCWYPLSMFSTTLAKLRVWIKPVLCWTHSIARNSPNCQSSLSFFPSFSSLPPWKELFLPQDTGKDPEPSTAPRSHDWCPVLQMQFLKWT